MQSVDGKGLLHIVDDKDLLQSIDGKGLLHT